LHRNCTGARHPLRSLAGESMSSWAFLPGVHSRFLWVVSYATE
jgi:hypothetical protein